MRRVRLRDVQNQQDLSGLGTTDEDEGGADPRRLWGEIFRRHRDALLDARQQGHNQFPVDVINRKAEDYANEVMRLAVRMK